MDTRRARGHGNVEAIVDEHGDGKRTDQSAGKSQQLAVVRAFEPQLHRRHPTADGIAAHRHRIALVQ